MTQSVIQLGPGIYRIPTFGDFINSFVFIDDDGQVTLVDCGLKRAPAKIVRGLAHIGKHPTDVTRIVLTHAHSDHAGGAADLVAATAASGVSIHRDDAAYAQSGVMPPREKRLGFGRLVTRLPAGGFTPVEVSAELTDGQELDIAGGLHVIHTPGHTPGHVSLLHPNSQVLITGDSLFNMRSKMSWSFAAFCTSYAQAKDSARRLADLDYRTAAFTHGPPIVNTGREAIRDFLREKHQ